jgi:hypothetical protein
MDEQPVAMPAAQHRQRGGGGAVDVHAVDFGRAAADELGGLVRAGLILRRHHDRRVPTERRRACILSRVRLRSIERVGIASDQRLHDLCGGAMRLDEHVPRLLATPGAARHLPDLLERALRSPQIAAVEA